MTAPNQGASGPIKTRYTKFETDRNPFLERARECAKVTIPSLLPPSGHNSSSQLPTPYQSLGARGVNNLSSKLVLSLFPANEPLFKLVIDDFELEKLAKREGARAEIDEAFARIERAVMTEIETSAARVSVFEALRHLLVAGNALLYLPEKGGVRVYHLDRYVVKRDASGNVLEMITLDVVSPDTLPDNVKGLCEIKPDETKNVDVYTRIRRLYGKWVVAQEINGHVVPNSEGDYPLDKCPWIALRGSAIDGEDYGRGLVEEYIGDLKSLEALSMAIVEGSAAAAKVLIFINPNGTTRKEDVTKAPNLGVVHGNAADISSFQLDKFGDFRVALEAANMISERLSFAFLLNAAVQRDAERVTAEEIRFIANELEAGLGGLYSVLSQELQLPLVTRYMHRMERTGRLPALPKNVARPSITTGINALGRGNDLTKLRDFSRVLAETFGPEAALALLVSDDFAKRAGAALGIDTKGLVKTEEKRNEEQARNQQLAMLQEMMKKLPQLAQQDGGAPAA